MGADSVRRPPAPKGPFGARWFGGTPRATRGRHGIVRPLLPHVLLAKAAIPGHDAELLCYRHDRDFTYRVDGVELMTSRVHASEEMLAELTLTRPAARPATRVLVGGLGMGFTLARTLDLVPQDARVDVAELVPEVVEWNRELLGHCAGHPLRDERVCVVVGDVGEVMGQGRDLYDAILLDVDNGPEGLSRPANDALYGDRGLVRARNALRAGGALAVWSSVEDAPFAKRMRGVGFAVQEHTVRARGHKGPRRTIWVGSKLPPRAPVG